MNKVISFLKESKTEMLENVTWMKWSELQSNALLVLVAATIFSLVISGMDWVFQTLLKLFYNTFY